MQDTRYKNLDAGYWISDTGYTMQDIGNMMQDTEYRIQEMGYIIQYTRYMQGPKCRLSDIMQDTDRIPITHAGYMTRNNIFRTQNR